MGRYKVIFRESVVRDMRRIPKRNLLRILATIDGLSDEPRPSGVEKLSGQEKYRVRQGNYRIIYEVRDDEVMVVEVRGGHRRDVYRRSRQRAHSRRTLCSRL